MDFHGQGIYCKCDILFERLLGLSFKRERHVFFLLNLSPVQEYKQIGTRHIFKTSTFRNVVEVLHLLNTLTILGRAALLLNDDLT